MLRQSKIKNDIQVSQGGQPLSGVGPGVGRIFAAAYFPKAQQILRIATGYFSVKGYAIGRAYFSNEVQLKILVGKREGMHVQGAIRKEIHQELLRGDAGSLYTAVVELVQRIKEGKFQILDGREMKQAFHCKIYISDSTVLWHGSANFSSNGFLTQAEQVTASFESEHITGWIDWFEEAAALSKDLLAEILEELEQWLELDSPFNAYLKALYLLYGLQESAYQKGALMPVYYQLSLIAWALHSIKSHGGACAVVATGLGKTVIGAEVAARLFHNQEIDSVILIAPKAVHNSWKKQLLTSRKIPTLFFGDKVLFLKTTGKDGSQADQLEEALTNANEKTLIIIDEAHIYRNQLKEQRAKKAVLPLERITRATKNKAKVLLLTGSAYGTSVQNLNSLLALLPHQKDNSKQWEVDNHQEFVALEPVCVLGIPHVQQMAKNRSDVDEEGRPYIDFTNSRKYLPQSLRSIITSFEPPLTEEVLTAFSEKCFSQKSNVPINGHDDDRGFFKAVTNTIENYSIQSWLSSTKVFVNCLERNLLTSGADIQLPIPYNEKSNNQQLQQGQLFLTLYNTAPAAKASHKTKSNKKVKPYKTKLKDCQQIREKALQPLLNKLTDCFLDVKLHKLKKILNERCLKSRSKVIIFVNFYLTAIYLEEELSKCFKRKVKIASTVCKKKHGLKTPSHREDLIHRFCPVANGKAGPGNVDVLICTDADGIGVNMQDADTIINYDLGGGADVLVQRVGRILRPTEIAGRLPYVYTFLPQLNASQTFTSKTINIIGRGIERFRRRHDKSSAILGASSLSKEGEEDISLSSETNLERLLFERDDFSKAAKNNPLAVHLSVLSTHRNSAEQLKEPMCSTRFYEGDTLKLILLLEYNTQIHPIVYVPDLEKVETVSKLYTLNLLKCDPEELLAPVSNDPDHFLSKAHIHQLADKAIQQWAETTGADIEQVQRKVTVLLQPKEFKGQFLAQQN